MRKIRNLVKSTCVYFEEVFIFVFLIFLFSFVTSKYTKNHNNNNKNISIVFLFHWFILLSFFGEPGKESEKRTALWCFSTYKCISKASDEAILQNICSWGVWSLLENCICFYKILRKALLENLICSYGISFSWKILCVLTKFWARSLGRFDLFLWYFYLLENRMCSCGILKKAFLEILMYSSTFCLSWKIYMCSCTIFGSPGKFDVFL